MIEQILKDRTDTKGNVCTDIEGNDWTDIEGK